MDTIWHQVYINIFWAHANKADTRHLHNSDNSKCQSHTNYTLSHYYIHNLFLKLSHHCRTSDVVIHADSLRTQHACQRPLRVEKTHPLAGWGNW